MDCSSNSRKENGDLAMLNYVCIHDHPSEGVKIMGHHETSNLSGAPEKVIFVREPGLMEVICLENTCPCPDHYRNKCLYDVIELPFCPGPRVDSCSSCHKTAGHTQEDPEKTKLSSSNKKENGGLESASDGCGKTVTFHAHLRPKANRSVALKNLIGPTPISSSCTVEYHWSPMLKYCAMKEMKEIGYKPIALL